MRASPLQGREAAVCAVLGTSWRLPRRRRWRVCPTLAGRLNWEVAMINQDGLSLVGTVMNLRRCQLASCRGR